MRSLFNPAEAETVVDRAFRELQLKSEAHRDAWGFGSTERCDVDLEDGIISFSGPGLLVTAPIQIVGSLAECDNSWLWGWDNPSILEDLRVDSHLARRFGERHGLRDYTTRKITTTEDQAWRFTALACHLSQASGAYRGPGETCAFFMTFHEVTIHSLP